MKKILALMLALCLALTMFVACGEKDDANTNNPDNGVVDPVQGNDDVPDDSTDEPVVDDADKPDVEVTVMTHDEYVAAAIDSAVVVETYVQDKQSWWDNKATLYTQAPDGAYFVYNVACSEEDYAKLVPGTKIRVTGYKSEWSGEVEIIDATFEIIEGADTFIATATDVTALLGTDELINHQNEFVSFKGMTVEPIKDANGNEAAFLYNWDGSGEDGNDLYFNVSVNGNTYNFTVESYLRDNTTDVYTAVKNLKIGDKIDMEGFLYWYEGVNPHITAVATAE